MAFLCPVRIKRSKKKKPLDDDSLSGPVPSMGRITGSASIETLVRVGIEKENGLGPESKMVVLHDFTPCVDDELEVKRGQIVHVLYQENDWVYVISENNQEGFIPHSYCAAYGSQMASLALNVKKKLPRDPGQTTVVPQPPASAGGSSTNSGGRIQQQRFGANNPPPDVLNPSIAMKSHENNADTNNSGVQGRVNAGMEHSDSDSFQDSMRPAPRLDLNNTRSQPDPSRSNSLMSETSSQPDIHPFFKDPSGRFVVLYSYNAQDENDLSVERGQCVTVLNSDDPDWYWVSKFDGQEGFVPSGFIYPLDAIQRQQGLNRGNGSQPHQPQAKMNLPYTQAFPPHMMSSSNGLPNPTITHLPHYLPPPQSQKPPSMQPPPWSGGSAGSSGPPSFSSNLQPTAMTQVPSTGIGSPNDLGLVPTAAGPQHPTKPTSLSPAPPPSNSGGGGGSGGEFQQTSYNGTELVMLYDYKAQAPDDLTVKRGDWVYADLNNQTVDGWLWTYAPKTRKYGFIPRAYAKPPAMTSL